MDSVESINGEEAVKGSWIPTIIIGAFFVIRWILKSQSNTAVNLRRMMQMQVRSISSISSIYRTQYMHKHGCIYYFNFI